MQDQQPPPDDAAAGRLPPAGGAEAADPSSKQVPAPLGKDLAITSWTPDDVDLPMVPLPGMQQTKFMSQHTFDERDAKKEAVSAEPKPCTLDGFRLLDVCRWNSLTRRGTWTWAG